MKSVEVLVICNGHVTTTKAELLFPKEEDEELIERIRNHVCLTYGVKLKIGTKHYPI